MVSSGLREFWIQFKALAWKNAILKFRFWGTLFLEMVVPIALIIALGVLNKYLPGSDYSLSIPYGFTPTNTFSNQNAVKSNSFRIDDPNNVFSQGVCNSYANIVWSCKKPVPCSNAGNSYDAYFAKLVKSCQMRKIAVAPSTSNDISQVNAAQGLVLWFNNNKTNTIFRSYDTFVYFNSESSFIDYVTQSGYAVNPAIQIYSAAVIISGGYPSFSFALRMNQTYNSGGNSKTSVMPSTRDPVIDYAIKSNLQNNSKVGGSYLYAFINNGAVALSDVVNSYFATVTCDQSGACTSAAANIGIATLGGVDFPSGPASVSLFWSSVGFVFALLMILTLLYPIANVIRALVQEKETKMKEGMMMMALRGDVHFMSWIFHFMCLFLPLAIILTIAGGQNLFAYSSPIFIFFYFFLFFTSATSFAYLISQIYDRALSAAIAGVVLFFGGFFVYVGLETGNSAGQATRNQILAACLHPATAFTFGTLAFTEWEGSNIGVTTNTWNYSNQYPISFQDTLTMLVVDTVWIGVFAWYISKVWPTEFGTHLPFYFIFNPFCWMNTCKWFFGIKTYVNISNRKVDNSEVPIEPVAESLRAQVEARKCVDIVDLYKEFDTNSGKKVAVDGLNLTMYSGQITAFLGHNGAGKSTTISILTGLIEPSGGTAIIEGMDIRKDLSDIRRNLGVCPQHDVLFPDLTVEEHLVLFASFKGAKGPAMRKEVDDMIRSVGLTEKRKAYSKTLSGGQKRKLSVGIAFIGGSRVVFLDEPTSGMDPYSRRFTWNIIKQHKENRVIVLTTHFMDEADLLGDRIAIMGDGKLKCCGSSLFLKNHYGVGYNITLEKADPNNFKSEKIRQIVQSYIPGAAVLTDAGAEISFQLPLSSSGSFQPLFGLLDLNGKTDLGINSYGISVTTLEEVFIKVAEGTNTQTTATEGRKQLQMLPQPSQTSNPELVDMYPNPMGQGKVISLDKDDNTRFEKVNETHRNAYFFIHLRAMILKRAYYFSRDRKSWLFQFIMPIIIVVIGLIIVNVTSNVVVQPSINISPSLYNTKFSNNYSPTNYNSNDKFCAVNNVYNQPSTYCVLFSGVSKTGLMSNVPNIDKFPALSASQATSIYNMSQSIYAHKTGLGSSQIGAFSIYSNTSTYPYTNISAIYSYFLHANYSTLWATPIYQNLFAASILKSYSKAGTTATVSMSYYPLPLTKKQTDALKGQNTALVVTFLSLAIPFIGASYSSYVVRERESKSKNQQMVSGVGLNAYWLANWIWDYISYLIPLGGILIAVYVTPNIDLLNSLSTGAFQQFCILMILFGAALSSFCYICSFLFKTPSGAQNIMIFVIFLTGLIMGVIGTVLRLLEPTIYMPAKLKVLFLLFPPFALIEGLQNMSLISTLSALELQGLNVYSVKDMNITGLNIIFLAFESVGYLVIVMLIEHFQASTASRSSNYLPTNKMPIMDSFKDDDVLEEEKRVQSGQFDHDSTILVKDVKKVYPGGKYAVRGVSLGIPNGECFGLLGINGAGKSTTLGMLSGEVSASSGEAFVAGLNLTLDLVKARRKIGFCPQYDALFDLLTGREHLELYARIQGVVEKDISKVVNAKIAEMGLTEYVSRTASTYSGGNKRKLSLAIAMMGEPSIVFLDEPSTGMDPVARRFMWQVISDIVTKREKCSMILTTHSMEEAEALCTRIGIMVGGELRCLGSSQRLRNKYGHGYQIEISMTLPTAEEVFYKAQQIANCRSPVSLEIPIETEDQLKIVFNSLGKLHWINRLSAYESGAELVATLPNLSLSYLASWWILEETFDNIGNFLTQNFGTYTVRERQLSKIRIEISSYESDIVSESNRRRLGQMFGSVETNRQALKIQDYSISQTSLEQVFNQFASQQEEETGKVGGMN